MAKLSIEKMQEIRSSAGLTYKEIAEKTGISESSITKLFGGFQANPSIDAISKIADILDCEVDDFLIRENGEPSSPYYLDKKTAEMAQYLKDQPELKVLLDATKDLSPENIKFVVDLVNRLKDSSNG